MITPSEVNTVAKKLEEENLRFRSFLKNHADCDELDQQFLALHNELFAGYDCCKCNNCCRAYSTTIQDYEIDSIAGFLGLTKQEFQQNYLVQTAGNYRINSPCSFLNEDGKRAIQNCKPKECQDFPYTDKSNRWGSLFGVISFAEECPVVFEILERLKDIYRFSR